MPTDSTIHFLMIHQRRSRMYSARRFLFCCTHKDSRCCFSCLCHMSSRSLTDSCTVLHNQSNNHWRYSCSQASSSGGESCRLARRWLLKASPIRGNIKNKGDSVKAATITIFYQRNKALSYVLKEMVYALCSMKLLHDALAKLGDKKKV